MAFRSGWKVLPPDQRIVGNEGGFPDDPDLRGLLRLFLLELREVHGIVRRHVHLLGHDCQKIGLMAGVADNFEMGLRINLVYSEYVVGGNQKSRGGVRISVAEDVLLAILKYIVEALDVTVFVE